jgi:ubiquinone/menaquinone biosynthesis C-methylase UbiE
MTKGQISAFLRSIGLLYASDRIRYNLLRWKNRKLNQEFKEQHPEFVFPPDYLMYESFQINYKNYFTEGKNAARWIADHLKKHVALEGKRILDWGCGPGRVVRHMPEVVNNGCKFYATDYNAKTIEWCTKNIKGVKFNANTLEASLPYPDNFFDCIYGLSVFTHLSEEMHYGWYKELHRVLKPDGVMFLTTQGKNTLSKLTPSELERYKKDELIVRGNVMEGHRTFSAYHPTAFMRKLFDNALVAEHIERTPDRDNPFPQDIWIVRKR